MNRDKMIEAMAKRMAWAGIAKYDASEDADDLWCNTLDYGQDHWLKVATAVLDLCGPERLDWAGVDGENDRLTAGPYEILHGNNGYEFTYWQVVQGEPHPSLKLVLEAAQAHATAAHWAPTPLGKLVGVE